MMVRRLDLREVREILQLRETRDDDHELSEEAQSGTGRDLTHRRDCWIRWVDERKTYAGAYGFERFC